MRYLVLLLLLIPTIGFSQSDIFSAKVDYGYRIKPDKPSLNYAIEYAHYKDLVGYYSSKIYGYTIGLQINRGTVQVPFLYSVKEEEWNDVVKMGVVLDKDIKDINLYFSFGFENLTRRYRTDGCIYTIEGYSKYNRYGFEFGGRLGVGFVYDKYHYKKWYKNY